MATGIVKEWHSKEASGMLFPLGAKANAPLIYVHRSQLIGGLRNLPLGCEVKFTKVRAEGGGVQAAHVELLEYGGQRTMAEAEKEARKRARNLERADQ